MIQETIADPRTTSDDVFRSAAALADPMCVLVLSKTIGSCRGTAASFRAKTLGPDLRPSLFENWLRYYAKGMTPVVVRPDDPLPRWLELNAAVQAVQGKPFYISVFALKMQLEPYQACRVMDFYNEASRCKKDPERVGSLQEAQAVVCRHRIVAHR
jgi:hypothetical protein